MSLIFYIFIATIVSVAFMMTLVAAEWQFTTTGPPHYLLLARDGFAGAPGLVNDLGMDAKIAALLVHAMGLDFPGTTFEFSSTLFDLAYVTEGYDFVLNYISCPSTGTAITDCQLYPMSSSQRQYVERTHAVLLRANITRNEVWQFKLGPKNLLLARNDSLHNSASNQFYYSVCDDGPGWNMREDSGRATAAFFCRQLGFTNVSAAPGVPSRMFVAGQGYADVHDGASNPSGPTFPIGIDEPLCPLGATDFTKNCSFSLRNDCLAQGEGSDFSESVALWCDGVQLDFGLDSYKRVTLYPAVDPGMFFGLQFVRNNVGVSLSSESVRDKNVAFLCERSPFTTSECSALDSSWSTTLVMDLFFLDFDCSYSASSPPSPSTISSPARVIEPWQCSYSFDPRSNAPPSQRRAPLSLTFTDAAFRVRILLQSGLVLVESPSSVSSDNNSGSSSGIKSISYICASNTGYYASLTSNELQMICRKAGYAQHLGSGSQIPVWWYSSDELHSDLNVTGVFTNFQSCPDVNIAVANPAAYNFSKCSFGWSSVHQHPPRGSLGDPYRTSCGSFKVHVACDAGLHFVPANDYHYRAQGSSSEPLVFRDLTNSVRFHLEGPFVGDQTQQQKTGAFLCWLMGYENATAATVNITAGLPISRHSPPRPVFRFMSCSTAYDSVMMMMSSGSSNSIASSSLSSLSIKNCSFVVKDINPTTSFLSVLLDCGSRQQRDHLWNFKLAPRTNLLLVQTPSIAKHLLNRTSSTSSTDGFGSVCFNHMLQFTQPAAQFICRNYFGATDMARVRFRVSRRNETDNRTSVALSAFDCDRNATSVERGCKWIEYRGDVNQFGGCDNRRSVVLDCFAVNPPTFSLRIDSESSTLVVVKQQAQQQQHSKGTVCWYNNRQGEEETVQADRFCRFIFGNNNSTATRNPYLWIRGRTFSSVKNNVRTSFIVNCPSWAESPTDCSFVDAAEDVLYPTTMASCRELPIALSCGAAAPVPWSMQLAGTYLDSRSVVRITPWSVSSSFGSSSFMQYFGGSVSQQGANLLCKMAGVEIGGEATVTAYRRSYAVSTYRGNISGCTAILGGSSNATRIEQCTNWYNSNARVPAVDEAQVECPAIRLQSQWQFQLRTSSTLASGARILWVRPPGANYNGIPRGQAYFLDETRALDLANRACLQFGFTGGAASVERAVQTAEISLCSWYCVPGSDPSRGLQECSAVAGNCGYMSSYLIDRGLYRVVAVKCSSSPATTTQPWRTFATSLISASPSPTTLATTTTAKPSTGSSDTPSPFQFTPRPTPPPRTFNPNVTSDSNSAARFGDDNAGLAETMIPGVIGFLVFVFFLGLYLRRQYKRSRAERGDANTAEEDDDDDNNNQQMTAVQQQPQSRSFWNLSSNAATARAAEDLSVMLLNASREGAQLHQNNMPPNSCGSVSGRGGGGGEVDHRSFVPDGLVNDASAAFRAAERAQPIEGNVDPGSPHQALAGILVPQDDPAGVAHSAPATATRGGTVALPIDVPPQPAERTARVPQPLSQLGADEAREMRKKSQPAPDMTLDDL